ncbi:Uncharacterised protein [Serratia proteamaculans]|jgi:hypothetical protein|nr:Uncharacterised protein [Serratia proteamaculans]CAI0953145.1 Uncharacterised protein [Serratia proteamaculans]
MAQCIDNKLLSMAAVLLSQKCGSGQGFDGADVARFFMANNKSHNSL